MIPMRGPGTNLPGSCFFRCSRLRPVALRVRARVYPFSGAYSSLVCSSPWPRQPPSKPTHTRNSSRMLESLHACQACMRTRREKHVFEVTIDAFRV